MPGGASAPGGTRVEEPLEVDGDDGVLEEDYTIVREGPYNKKRHPTDFEGLHRRRARTPKRGESHRHEVVWTSLQRRGYSAMNHLREHRAEGPRHLLHGPWKRVK